MRNASVYPPSLQQLGQSYDLGISPTAAGAYAQNNASVSTASLSFTVPLFSGFRIHMTLKQLN